MLDFSRAQFDYEPYPVCYVPEVMDSGLYETLRQAYPPTELFKFQPKLGRKYGLSELRRPENYRAFLAGNPDWKAFHEFVKSDAFVRDVLDLLRFHHIDLGLAQARVRSRARGRRLGLWARAMGRVELSARFEFSMMDPEGGHILPHTDDPHKLITLVISMMAPGEWNPEWGGGTEVVLPQDRSRIYNQLNEYLGFDDVETVRVYPFEPNQCVLFVKTYNSWHQVSPIRADSGASMRRTLTINIERRR